MKNLRFLMLLAAPACLWAHGLIESPPSRTWICGNETRPNEIQNGTPKTPACSTAFKVDQIAGYNFMAVVTHGLGRAQVTPLPKNVCGFDGETWKGAATPWDAPMPWPTQPMSAGKQTITWNISWGPHFDDTEEFRYWITKADFVFSPQKALTWDDFETEAFCVLKYDGARPDANPDVTADKPQNRFHTRCNVPARTGHHVIYGEWGRTPPTLERFHSCVDVAFGGTSIAPRRATAPRGAPRFLEAGAFRDLLGRQRPADLRSPPWR